jgi:hypothetical protein
MSEVKSINYAMGTNMRRGLATRDLKKKYNYKMITSGFLNTND